MSLHKDQILSLTEDELNFTFETPRSVPDILLLLIKVDPDNSKSYHNLRNHVLIQLNQSQQKLLDTKYKSYCFKSMASVPTIFPTFALRNVYLSCWHHKDISEIEYNRTGNYMQRSHKNKSNSSRFSEKVVSYQRSRNKMTKRFGRNLGAEAKEKQKLVSMKKFNIKQIIMDA